MHVRIFSPNFVIYRHRCGVRGNELCGVCVCVGHGESGLMSGVSRWLILEVPSRGECDWRWEIAMDGKGSLPVLHLQSGHDARRY